MTYIQLFYRFLKINHAYYEFISNVNNFQIMTSSRRLQNLEDAKYYMGNQNVTNYIIYAFRWGHTKQGHSFWENLHNKWENILEYDTSVKPYDIVYTNKILSLKL